ncbi:hypothetical protein FGADI_13093 [Fusarium gaditjirri]|uniref:Nephrocystin 3-like N-terminal domain-containing protein n=1 Tax=Fusarium gaditjirri TaxID=282569 RepID=A0A8H4WMW7_9HYPO|nr:hypothetical protein FGADI_13093 [Fusarium gaditjirri]
MSGLESLVALNLVCNVVQLIEVGLKTATLCKNAYRTGEPDPELSVYAQNLAETASSLTQSLKVSPQPLNLDDTRLLNLARNCRDAEAEWRKKTPARFLSQQQSRKRDRFGAVFRGILNKPEIDRMESQLQKAKDSLVTDLLVGIFKSLDVSKVQTNDLQDKFRDLLQASSASETKLHELIQRQVALVNMQISGRIDQAEASTKTHVTTELASHESRLKSHADQGKDTLLTEAEARENSRKENEAYERLLRSFQYPDMNYRRNEIHSSHASTFHWMFDGGSLDVPHPDVPFNDASDPDAKDLVCSSFVKWLKSTESRYWISGRPGMGKSVLMKFIISHKQTLNLLRQWQPEVQILTHFFWKVGSPMQSSFKGFLCSLVYQLSSLDKEYAMGCLKQNSDWTRKTGPGDWDREDLQSLVAGFLSNMDQPFCFFVDGLDEFMDCNGVGVLLAFLDGLHRSSRLLKICMSSRPESGIQTRLSREPDLKMQDLTVNDIRSYSRAILSKEIVLTSSPVDVEVVVRDISDKAGGVFLWAVLVTRSIARGISNGDSEADIRQRLRKTPEKLYKLYLDMWTRLGEDSDLYKSWTALIFKLVLFTWQSSQSEPLSIFELMLASSDDLWSTHVNNLDDLSTADLEERCNELFTRLPFRTADLFEVVQISDSMLPDLSEWASKSDSPVLRFTKLKVEAIHQRILQMVVSGTERFISLPNGLHLSGDTLVKASIAYSLISEFETLEFWRYSVDRDTSWDAERANFILRMTLDFRYPLCLGDHMLITLHNRGAISCRRHKPYETTVYVEISMSILVQIFLQQVVQDNATLNRHEVEEVLNLKAFPQTIWPVMLGVEGGYFLEPSSTDLPIFQRYCYRLLLPETYSPSSEDSEDTNLCRERMDEASRKATEREHLWGTQVESPSGIEKGIGPHGMNFYLCSSCKAREQT